MQRPKFEVTKEQLEMLPIGMKLYDLHCMFVLATLERCNYNRSWAAEVLGMTPRGLRLKLHKYGFYVEKKYEQYWANCEAK